MTLRTRTGVHRADEHDAAGERNARLRAADGDSAVLERLTQHLERVPRELGQLVEEKHAMVREAKARYGSETP